MKNYLKIQSAINSLDPGRSNDRDQWVKVGMAIHAATSGSDKGLVLFDEFSKQCPEKYDAKSVAQVWRSFSPGKGISEATLFHMAKQDGNFCQIVGENPILQAFRKRKKSPNNRTITPKKRDKIWNQYDFETFDRVHDYTDLEGFPTLRVAIRYKHSGKKDVLQFRPDGNDQGWIAGGADRHFPYRVQAVQSAIDHGETIYIVEGEKCVEAMESIGLTATTNAGGAGNWKNCLNKYFQNAIIVILPDNDETGEKHARNIACNLRHIARSITIKRISGLGEKCDVADLIS